MNIYYWVLHKPSQTEPECELSMTETDEVISDPASLIQHQIWRSGFWRMEEISFPYGLWVPSDHVKCLYFFYSLINKLFSQLFAITHLSHFLPLVRHFSFPWTPPVDVSSTSHVFSFPSDRSDSERVKCCDQTVSSLFTRRSFIMHGPARARIIIPCS